MGGPKPSFTSNVTIKVGPDVPAGSYEIKIKGMGADGTTHNCTYILIIQKPTTPSETIEEEEEEIPEDERDEEEEAVEEEEETEEESFPEIGIISPKEMDEVPISTMVAGTFSGELPEEQYMWVVINPHPSPGQWWPQGRIDPREEWEILVWLGREENIGDKFDIAVILVNKEDNDYYLDYLKTGEETGYPGIPLPDSTVFMGRITVIRK